MGWTSILTQLWLGVHGTVPGCHDPSPYTAGWWWLEPWKFEWLSIQLGMEFHHPNWLSLHHFSEGWLNHQSVLILYIKSCLQWWGDHNPSLPCFVRWHGYCSIGVSGELSILQTSVDWVAHGGTKRCVFLRYAMARSWKAALYFMINGLV